MTTGACSLQRRPSFFCSHASLAKSIVIGSNNVKSLLVAKGVLALCGMHDAQAKPVLFCSCNDNTVRLYDLPSFNERGKIFAKEEVRAIQIGPGGLFFTGDGTGELKVWKWLTSEVPAA